MMPTMLMNVGRFTLISIISCQTMYAAERAIPTHNSEDDIVDESKQ